MNLPQRCARFLLVPASCLLASCIDSREEVWLDANGGGRADITYTVPAAVVRMQGGEAAVSRMIAEFLDETPAITSSGREISTLDGQTRVNIQISFASALDLMKAAQGNGIKRLPSAAHYLAGEIQASLHGRSIELTRTISAGKALPGAVFLPASEFEGHHLVSILHLPAPATSSNATRTEDVGRTLVWDFPLAQAVKSPVTTSFVMELPIPWTLVTSVAIPVSLAAGFAFLRLRKSRPRIVATR